MVEDVGADKEKGEYKEKMAKDRAPREWWSTFKWGEMIQNWNSEVREEPEDLGS